MIVKGFPVGAIMANCYILMCENTKEAVVIDPGDEAEKIKWEIKDLGANVKYVLNTHGHFDHAGANKEVVESTKAKFLIHKEDEFMLDNLDMAAMAYGLSSRNSPMPDEYLKDNDVITFGDVSLKVMHTPGHSPGCVCFLVNDIMFSGDTLFAGSIGRTDLPGGDYSQIIQSIKEKLAILPDETKVYPGHGGATTISKEKQYNPFLR